MHAAISTSVKLLVYIPGLAGTGVPRSGDADGMCCMRACAAAAAAAAAYSAAHLRL